MPAKVVRSFVLYYKIYSVWNGHLAIKDIAWLRKLPEPQMVELLSLMLPLDDLAIGTKQYLGQMRCVKDWLEEYGGDPQWFGHVHVAYLRDMMELEKMDRETPGLPRTFRRIREIDVEMD